MKTILKIFISDMSAVVRQFFSLAIIVAISILPALYAWVNIYANGNPYTNTGNIKIAVASNDPGLTLDDGTYVNSTQDVFEDLKTKTSIGWQFPDTEEEAIEGVRSGKYYAAIIFQDNFTYNMYHFEQALTGDKVPLTFYRNDKKNAVASKITDTAASSLIESINTRYLETLFGEVLGDVNDLSDTIESEDTAENALNRLREFRDNLDAYSDTLGSFSSQSSSVQALLASTEKQLEQSRANGRNAKTRAARNLADAEKTADALAVGINDCLKQTRSVLKSLDKALSDLEKAEENQDTETIVKRQQEALDLTGKLIVFLQNIKATMPSSGSISGTQAVVSTIDAMTERASIIQTALSKDIPDIDAAYDALAAVRKLEQKHLEIDLTAVKDNLSATLKALEPFLDSLSGMLDDVDPVLNAAGGAVASIDMSIQQLGNVLDSASRKLTEVIDQVESADAEDKVNMLIEALGGDTSEYSKFFSSLVDVEVEEIYQVASYGAAMAPFYSVLAIWVGGVILVSILKTGIDRKKFPKATEAQAFFGRFLIFFLIGQVQAAVIVLGDIYLLGCAPLHPWLMEIAAGVASLVFVLLIYALTRTFGDVGKAIVVVIMVVQIAGSSGSYPIEILPPIFAKIYRFFPFPYAINAIREAMCGTYGKDYYIYLAELLIFLVVALLIGLLVRRSFIGINDFVSEKIEETEVL